MERYFPVIRAFSLILFFFGLTLVIPLGFSIASHRDQGQAILQHIIDVAAEECVFPNT